MTTTVPAAAVKAWPVVQALLQDDGITEVAGALELVDQNAARKRRAAKRRTGGVIVLVAAVAGGVVVWRRTQGSQDERRRDV